MKPEAPRFCHHALPCMRETGPQSWRAPLTDRTGRVVVVMLLLWLLVLVGGSGHGMATGHANASSLQSKLCSLIDGDARRLLIM